MRLVELFNKVADWEWESLPGTMQNTAVFSVEEYTYKVTFDDNVYAGSDPDIMPYITMEDPLITDVIFSLKGARQQTGKYPTDITGSGNEFIVFSTVKNIINEYMNKHSPDYLHFEAQQPSRKKLYRRFVKNLSKRVEMFNDIDDAEHYLIRIS